MIDSIKKITFANNFATNAFGLQLIVLVLFACFFDYKSANSTSDETNLVSDLYAMYQDIHVMIFVGFGVLMTFLQKYGFSSIGLNFFVAAFTIQWGIIITNFIHQLFDNNFHNVTIDIVSLILGDFACGTVLISFGAVLGRIKPLQLLYMALFEVIFYNINEYIGAVKLETVDMGGSIFVHSFGAFFGLGVSYMLGVPSKAEKMLAVVKKFDLYAMIGTLFLWMFWPSFNGALAPAEYFSQERVVINTVFALCASCVTAFATSHYFNGKFDIVAIQNATLAGGVSVGSSSDLVIGPFGAILMGSIAGVMTTIGYRNISSWVEKKFKVFDTCGVNNLHGIPGILGGIGGSISAMLAGEKNYGGNITEVFSARARRSAFEQGVFQFLALVITIAFSIVTGLLVGKILNTSYFNNDENKAYKKFDDEPYWVNEDEDEDEEANENNETNTDTNTNDAVDDKDIELKSVV